MIENKGAENRWRGREPIMPDDPRHPSNDPAYSERCDYCGAPTKPEHRQVCIACWRLGA